MPETGISRIAKSILMSWRSAGRAVEARLYSRPMRPAVRPILFLTFAATGFSALTLQVVWQRVLSLHAGIDLMAATTVVTAFMAGLGLGSLAGGAMADRLGAK